LKAELTLDHPKRMLDLGADMRFGGFDQIIQSALRPIRQHSPLSWSHGDAEADSPALHLVSLLNSLVAGIRIRFASLSVSSNWCRDRIGHFLCMRLLSSGSHRPQQPLCSGCSPFLDAPLH